MRLRRLLKWGKRQLIQGVFQNLQAAFATTRILGRFSGLHYLSCRLGRKERDVIPSHRRCRERRDFGDVIGRGNFDHVHPGEVEASEPAQDRSCLPSREPAYLRRAGSRRKGGIERVDIKAQLDRLRPDDLADPFGNGLRTGFVNVLGGDDRHSLADGPVENVAMNR